MCGHYTVFSEEENLEMKLILEEIFERYKSRPEVIASSGISKKIIRPADVAPMIGLINGKPTSGLMQWGWPLPDGKSATDVMYNKRRETAHDKFFFADAFKKWRCIIPCVKFGESDRTARYKVDYLFWTDEAVTYMGGMYREFTDATGQKYRAFTIFTAPANSSVRSIHDRMPVILHTEGEREAWLRDFDAAREILVAKDDTTYKNIQIA